MSKFGSYRNVAQSKDIVISKEVAAYNVSKGLLFPIQNMPCPPNQVCAQVVRYSYVQNNPNCQCITQPCQCAAPMTEYVPADAKIYSVMPDCPPNAMCRPTLYAAKGKVNPVLEIPSTINKGDDAKEYKADSVGAVITKKLDNVAVGMLVAAWGLDGYLAYKFWGKSLIWKAGIIAFTAANAYSTMKYLKKKKSSSNSSSSNSEKQSLVKEIADKIVSKSDKVPTQAEKDEMVRKISTLSIEDLKIAKEFVTEMFAIDFKQAPEIFMKKYGDLSIKFNNKYGAERMQKIGDVLK